MRIYKFLVLFLLLISYSLSAQEQETYKVKKGETLKDVADKFGVSYIKLLRENKGISKKPKIDTEVVIPGSKFVVRKKKPVDVRDTAAIKFPKIVASNNAVHTVKPKETLYSLSKQYGIPMADLIKKNTFLSENGLKIGQVLEIPTKTTTVGEKTGQTHTTLPKETLYSISKKYEVDLKDLTTLNKETLANGLSIGDVLKIPSRVEKVKSLKENEHLILSGETLYSISRKYGISVAELQEANHNLEADSLVVGRAIALPGKVIEKTKNNINPIYKEIPIYKKVNNKDEVYKLIAKTGISRDSLVSINPYFDSIVENGGDLLLGFGKENVLFTKEETFTDSIVNGTNVNTLLMLPFNFKQNDSLSAKTLFSSKNGLPAMVADFYMGAKMAIDSLERQGVNVNLTPVDTEKSVHILKEKISYLKASTPDVIVGPLYTDNVKYVATQFSETPIYYPIYSKKQQSLSASNVIKTAPEKGLYKSAIKSFIKENRKGEHLVLVGLKENKLELERLKKEFIKKDAAGLPIKDDVKILALEKEYIESESFLESIKLEKGNWILVTEDKNVIVSDVFNNIKSIPKDSILDTPVRVLSYQKTSYAGEKIPYNVLAKYNYTYSTGEVEYLDILNTNFEKRFLKVYNNYPSEMALRGFSVTYDAIVRFLKEDAPDRFKASNRYRQIFYYEGKSVAKNKNRAVFVNAITNKKDKGLQIVRLR